MFQSQGGESLRYHRRIRREDLRFMEMKKRKADEQEKTLVIFYHVGVP